MRIAANKFVSVIYDLHIGDGIERKLQESATLEEPMDFIFGVGMTVPAFEEKLIGLKAGDKFKFTLTPANAYGEYNEQHLMELPKSAFEVNGWFDSELVKVGNVVPMMDSDNKRLNGSVMEVRDNIVVVDFNHPLAGKTLYFSGKVIDVHLPTQDEVDALTTEGSGCGHNCEGGCSDCHQDEQYLW